MLLTKQHWVAIKTVVFILCLTPFLSLLIDGVNDQLGANPIETLHFSLGDWALRLLCIDLAITPIKIIIRQSWPIRFRRMLGLFAFFYASLHLLVYLILDLSLSWTALVDEVPKSPYILAGLATYLLLLPLAATSTKAMQKRLGRHWLTLHHLVYVAAISGLVHYFWLVKKDYSQPYLYALVVTLLFAVRILDDYRKNVKYKVAGKKND